MQAGANHGYELLWIIVIGLVFALIIQSLAANLGVSTEKHLAELCKVEYPKYVKLCLWLLAEVAVIAADIPEVIGTAFALNILFHISLWIGVLLTGFSTLLLIGLQKYGVLVVQEKSGRFRGTGVWKIPTGVVDEGEDIFKAAMREVKEETGIDTEFQEILAFRQSHKSFFGKSDLFFLCFLHPLSFDIQNQELEIEAAQWMPFEEYAAQPFAQKHELFKYIADLCLAKLDRSYAGFSPLPTTSFFNDQISYLYSNIQDLKLTSSADHQ